MNNPGFLECYTRIGELKDSKPELALLELERMIPTIPQNIGNDIFFTDVADVLKQTSIQRRIEVFGEFLDQGQRNDEAGQERFHPHPASPFEGEGNIRKMTRSDAVRIVAGVMKKFDLEEQWQLLKRLPERYHSKVHDAFGFDEARRLMEIKDVRKILIELYHKSKHDIRTDRAVMEKVARRLSLPQNPPAIQQGETIDKGTGLPIIVPGEYDSVAPDNDQEAQGVIEELLGNKEELLGNKCFWPALLQNPDLNVFVELIKSMLAKYPVQPSEAFAHALFGSSCPEPPPEPPAGWNGLFSTVRRAYQANRIPSRPDLLAMRRLLRQAWLKATFGIEWEKEEVSLANSTNRGFKNLMSVPLEKVTLKVGLAEVLEPFADENKRLREEFSYYATEKAGISNPLPVIYSPESPDVSGIVKMPLREVLQPSGYTLIQLEPAEVLSSISRRHDALLAINDGFFVVQGAEFREGHAAIMAPVGFLLVDAKVLVPPTAKRAALLINDENKPCIGFVSMKNISIELADVSRILIERDTNRIGSEEQFTLAPFNQRHFNPENKILLYTSRFGSRTLQEFNRVQIGVLHNRIIFVQQGDDEKSVFSPIPQNGFVISYPIREDTASWLPNLKIGGKVKLTLTSYYDLNGGRIGVSYDSKSGTAIVQGLSCGPLLWAKGINYVVQEDFWDPKHVEAEEPWSEEFLLEHLFPSNVDKEWIQKKHPRTAIGIKDGKIAMVVHDGDKNTFGKSITCLGEFVKKDKWDVGLNLDGGSSSEAVVCSNVENIPSYKGQERLIATGVMVVPRQKKILKDDSIQAVLHQWIRKHIAPDKDESRLILSKEIWDKDMLERFAVYIEEDRLAPATAGQAANELLRQSGSRAAFMEAVMAGLESWQREFKIEFNVMVNRKNRFAEWMGEYHWHDKAKFSDGALITVGAVLFKEWIALRLSNSNLLDDFCNLLDDFCREVVPQAKFTDEEVNWFKGYYLEGKTVRAIALELGDEAKLEKVRLAIDEIRDTFFDELLGKYREEQANVLTPKLIEIFNNIQSIIRQIKERMN